MVTPHNLGLEFYAGILCLWIHMSVYESLCGLQVDKEFDALIIDTAAPLDGTPVFDTFEEDKEVCKIELENYNK